MHPSRVERRGWWSAEPVAAVHWRPAALLQALLPLLYPVAVGQAAVLATGSERDVWQVAAALEASPPLASALERAVAAQLAPWLQRVAVLSALLTGAAAPPAAAATPEAVGALLQQLRLPLPWEALRLPTARSLPAKSPLPHLRKAALAALTPAGVSLSVPAAGATWTVAGLPPPGPPQLLQLPAEYQARRGRRRVWGWQAGPGAASCAHPAAPLDPALCSPPPHPTCPLRAGTCPWEGVLAPPAAACPPSRRCACVAAPWCAAAGSAARARRARCAPCPLPLRSMGMLQPARGAAASGVALQAACPLTACLASRPHCRQGMCYTHAWACGGGTCAFLLTKMTRLLLLRKSRHAGEMREAGQAGWRGRAGPRWQRWQRAGSAPTAATACHPAPLQGHLPAVALRGQPRRGGPAPAAGQVSAQQLGEGGRGGLLLLAQLSRRSCRRTRRCRRHRPPTMPLLPRAPPAGRCGCTPSGCATWRSCGAAARWILTATCCTPPTTATSLPAFTDGGGAACACECCPRLPLRLPLPCRPPLPAGCEQLSAEPFYRPCPGC